MAMKWASRANGNPHHLRDEMLESELQKLAMEYLKRAVPSGYFIRVERKGRQLWGAHSATTPGAPDIIGCLGPSGRFIGIELKAKRGTLLPSQRALKAQVEAQGGLYFMVKSMAELEAAVFTALKSESGRTNQGATP